MDIELMEKQLKGFEEKGKQLRAQEAIFLKVQGMKEQIEQSRSEASDIESEIQDLKESAARLFASAGLALLYYLFWLNPSFPKR